ncbi:MAG: glycosyltransferase [Flavisolibacter sp.]
MIKKIRVLLIISDIKKALSYEWTAEFINKKKYEIFFIILNNEGTELENYLLQNDFYVKRVNVRGKKDWPTAIINTYRIIKSLRPDVVHCHMLQANIIGLIASRLAGVPMRIYTRHHSSEHHVYFPRGILLDKLANRLATHIIAISGVVKRILIEWEKAKKSKVILIPHGFLLYEFSNLEETRLLDFKNKYGLDNKYPVIGVVSRFTKWKGIQYIIPAYRKLLELYPNGMLLLLNAVGDYEEGINKMVRDLPASSYRLIAFENDIGAAYQTMDVLVHVPIDAYSEAFGQVYIESLSAGIPSIFTKSGIANEEAFNNEVAVIVDYKSSKQIFLGVIEILKDKVRTNQRILAGKELAAHYNFIFYIERLEELYASGTSMN